MVLITTQGPVLRTYLLLSILMSCSAIDDFRLSNHCINWKISPYQLVKNSNHITITKNTVRFVQQTTTHRRWTIDTVVNTQQGHYEGLSLLWSLD